MVSQVHGFFGRPGGHFTTFDAREPGTAQQQGTNGVGHHWEGSISGDYGDANGCRTATFVSGRRDHELDPPESVFTAADTLGN